MATEDIVDTSQIPFTPEQKTEFDALIRKIEATAKEARLHPIVYKTMFECFDEEGDGTTWAKKAPADLRPTMDKWIADAQKDGTIGDAVFGLVQLALFMDHVLKLDVQLYGEIVSITNDAIIKYDLLKLVNVAEKDAGKKAAAIRDTTGATKQGAPAKVGEKPPEGTLRPDQINPGKRRL